MRKPARVTVVAFMVGAMFVGGIAAGSAAGASPRQAPTRVASSLLAPPSIRFSFPGFGSVSAGGAAAIVDVTYRCGGTIDSPILPQLLGSSKSLTLQVSQAIRQSSTGGGHYISHGSRTINNLICDGGTYTRSMGAVADPQGFRFVAGDSQALVVMQVCDLFGCANASSGAVVTLS